MFSEIKRMIDRALLLGLTDISLDEQNIVYLMDGKVCLNLYNLLANYVSDIIEIPEGVEIIYIDNTDDYKIDYKNNILIKFPSSLIYFGVDRSVKYTSSYNQIQIFKGQFDISWLFCKNISLDFSKCKFLGSINVSSFAGVTLNNLYFSENVKIVNTFAFRKCYINSVILPGVEVIHASAFDGANIKILDLGTSLNSCEMQSLDFSGKVPEVIWKDVKKIYPRAMGNIENLYMPYDFSVGLDELNKFMSEMQLKITKKHTNIDAVIFEIEKKIEKFKQDDWDLTQPMHDINMHLSDILTETTEESDIRYLFKKLRVKSKKFYSSHVSSDLLQKLYYYDKSDTLTDVRKRNYMLLPYDYVDNLRIYVEAGKGFEKFKSWDLV